MSYRTSPSFERQPTPNEYARAIFKLHMLLKFERARVLAYADLIEARELEIADMQSDAREQGEHD